MSEPGVDVMARFVGPENVDRGREYLEALDPEFHRHIMDFVYGEIYAGDVLDAKTRALCTVAMLATLGQQLQLGVYVRAARRQGASEEEIREVLRQVAVYAGFPSAWNALATMKQSLEGSQTAIAKDVPTHELLPGSDRRADLVARADSRLRA